jgi:hypothetical protein
MPKLMSSLYNFRIKVEIGLYSTPVRKFKKESSCILTIMGEFQKVMLQMILFESIIYLS